METADQSEGSKQALYVTDCVGECGSSQYVSIHEGEIICIVCLSNSAHTCTLVLDGFKPRWLFGSGVIDGVGDLGGELKAARELL